MGSSTGESRLQRHPIADLVKEIYEIWIAERPTQLAAALAYFGLFSFAPVLYIAFSIAGIFIDPAILMERFLTQVESTLGPGVTQFILDMINRAAGKASGGTFLVSLISLAALFFAAMGVFSQLQFALNAVWQVPNPAKGTLLRTVRRQFFSFLMVIAVGLLLVAAAIFSFFASWLSSLFVRIGIQPYLTALGFAGLAALSFAVMYKLLPNTRIAWRDVWLGAVTAAGLVTVGGGLITFFLKHTSLASALEAAGSFVVLLTGFYYFAQIFLLGAILSRVYARRYGSKRPVSADRAAEGPGA